MNFAERRKQEKELAKLIEETGLLDKITLKKIKTGFGHDLGGMYCDVYLKGYGKICYLNDDGWGGEVEIHYETDEKQKAFETLLKENNIRQLMFDNGWAFMKDVNEISLHTQAESLIELKLAKIETDKFNKKRERACEKGIIFGTENSYRGISYKMPLKAIVMHKGGIKVLQDAYNRVKKNLKKDEKIFNTNLEKLGVKL